MLAPASTRADRTVAVSSVVDPLYAEQRAENPGLVQTYIFARGRYINSVPMDRTLEKMEFRTIAKSLAADLQKVLFEPAASLLEADLVLLVHWGAVQPNETAAGASIPDYDLMRDASNAFNEARGRLDDPATRNEPGVLTAVIETHLDFRREAASVLSAHTGNETQRQSTIELLGLQSGLYQAEGAVFGTSLGDTIRQMMNEERYFVIVIAYDGQALREGRKKRVWTTRASMRGPGVNFAEALNQLSDAAAPFHGLPQKGLVFAPSGERKRKDSEVLIGDLKVLGDSAPPVPAGKR